MSDEILTFLGNYNRPFSPLQKELWLHLFPNHGKYGNNYLADCICQKHNHMWPAYFRRNIADVKYYHKLLKIPTDEEVIEILERRARRADETYDLISKALETTLCPKHQSYAYLNQTFRVRRFPNELHRQIRSNL